MSDTPPRMMPGQEGYTPEELARLHTEIEEIALFEELYGSEEVLIKEQLLDIEELECYTEDSGERRRGRDGHHSRPAQGRGQGTAPSGDGQVDERR